MLSEKFFVPGDDSFLKMDNFELRPILPSHPALTGAV
jgi:hypothetical protein